MPNIRETPSLFDSRPQTVRWLISALFILALSLGGIWELFRGGAHREHLLLFFLAFLLTGLTVLGVEYLHSRKALAEVRLAHDRLRSALLAGKSVAWDLDVKTGRNIWFGDLMTMFAISSESLTVQNGEFYRRVHPEDRARVKEAISRAQVDRTPYASEFRVVHDDGAIHWVSASGIFKYSKRGDAVRMLGVAIDITEYRQTEQSLLASQAKFAKAFQASPVALTLTSAMDHRFIEINETFERATGWKREEVIGRTSRDIHLWNESGQRETLVKDLLEKKSFRNVEIRYHRKDGSQRVSLGSGELIDLEGEPCVMWAFVDITDRQRAELALRQKEHDLAEAQRLGHVGSWECEADGSDMHWSEELYRIYGLDPSQPAPAFESLQNLYTPETRERVLHAMKSKTFPEMNMELVRPDGTKRWVQTRFDASRRSDGTILKLRGVTRDITEEKRITDQLRESEERFRRLVDHIADAIFVDDVAGRAIFANDRFFSLFGYRQEQLSSLRLEDLLAPEYRAEARSRHDRRMSGESVATNFEYQAIRVDGSRMWIEVQVVPIVDQQGKIMGTQSALSDITERKRDQQAIRDSEQRLRHLIEASNDWVWEADKDGRFTYASEQSRRLIGYEPEEFLGKRPSEVMPADEAHRLDEITHRLLAEQKPFFGLQGASIRKDGQLVVWEANGIPVFDQTGEFCGFRGFVRDITDSNRAEMELRESEERFRRVVEHIGDALVVDEVSGRIVFANDQFLTLFGIGRDELEHVKVEDYVAPHHRSKLRDRHRQRMNGNNLSSRYEFEGIRRDGRRVWIEAEEVSVKDYAGKLVGSQRVLRDITEQKHAEQVVLESEERLRQLISSSNDWVWEVDANQVYTYASSLCLGILGYQPEEMIGKTLFELMPDYEAVRVASSFSRISADRKPFWGLRNVKKHKDGRLVVLETNGVPVLDAEGNLRGYRGMERDISERDRAEQALRESEERFRLVTNTAPVMIWMSAPDKLFYYFNRPWLDFTGGTIGSQVDEGWLKWVHPDDSSRCFQTYSDAFDQRRRFEMQYRLRRHDGEYRWVLDFGVPRFNPDGSFAGYIGSCVDITERKQAEEALATIGRRLIEAHEEERTRIGRELHDDINQRLALLSVELQQWLNDHPSSALIRELMRHTQQRILEVGRDVQNLSHRLHSSKLDYLGLAKAASSFCRELSRSSKVEVIFNDAGIPRILPKEISLCLFRVLQEALQNALKHSGVQSFTVDLYASSDAIELTVEDSGIGFEPGEALGAQGIGLISMRERLQLVRGDLSVDSAPGRGTRIHARVPFHQSAIQALAG